MSYSLFCFSLAVSAVLYCAVKKDIVPAGGSINATRLGKIYKIYIFNISSKTNLPYIGEPSAPCADAILKVWTWLVHPARRSLGGYHRICAALIYIWISINSSTCHGKRGRRLNFSTRTWRPPQPRIRDYPFSSFQLCFYDRVIFETCKNFARKNYEKFANRLSQICLAMWGQ